MRFAATVELGGKTATGIEVLAEVVEPSEQAAFAALSYSRRRGLVQPIKAAKAPETRARRVAKAVTDLAAPQA